MQPDIDITGILDTQDGKRAYFWGKIDSLIVLEETFKNIPRKIIPIEELVDFLRSVRLNLEEEEKILWLAE